MACQATPGWQRRLATADNDVQRLQGEARLAALAAATADVLHAEAMSRSALSLASQASSGDQGGDPDGGWGQPNTLLPATPQQQL